MAVRGLPATAMVPLTLSAQQPAYVPAKVGAPGTVPAKLSFSLGAGASDHSDAVCNSCNKPCVFTLSRDLPLPPSQPLNATVIQGRVSPAPFPVCTRRQGLATGGTSESRDRRFAIPAHPAQGVGTDRCQDVEEEDSGVKVYGRDYDQYTVPRKEGELYLWRLIYYVMCRGCCGSPADNHLPPFPKEARSVLGPFGHLERFSAWSHFVAFFVFCIYGTVRHLAFYRSSTAFAWATGAAFITAITFLSSTIYHVTSPDPAIAQFTRQLDFGAIYASISICSVADLAAVTRGFVNVPVVSIVDVPCAAVVMACFFAFRRYQIECEETLLEEYTGCSAGGNLGLLRRWHSDGEYSPLRQSTSLAIAAFYFTVTPAVIENSMDASLILGLQGGALTIVIGGMMLDNISGWPDNVMHKRKNGVPCTSFPSCGCAITSHGIWHILAVGGACLTAIAREWAVFAL